jgi:antitoxin (DNA-binding transcriptional repressor) of toxin-antitoxin stability system
MKKITTGKFKDQCLQIIEVVKNKKEKVIITKDSLPVAQLIPIEEAINQPLFGYMKEYTHITGDIIGP